MQTINFPRGHGILKAYMGLRPQDPDTLEYEALLKQAYGEEKAEEYLSRSIHHVLVYPYLSVQSPLQQLRCLRPISADKTLSEIWHFRPQGRARGDLPPQPVVLQPRQLAGDDDQRRRPGELDQGPVGPEVRRAATGSASTATTATTESRTAYLLQPRHLRGGDAQPVPRVDRST